MMLHESDLAATRDPKSRLEQARHKYESLLLHATASLVPAESLDSTRWSHEMPAQASLFDLAQGESLGRSRSRSQTPERHFSSVDRSASGGMDVPQFNFTYGDKDDTIVSLQEENDRLKRQLEHLMASTDQLINDAQASQRDIIDSYETRLMRLEKENSVLRESKLVVEAAVQSTQAHLSHEREQLRKAMIVIEGFGRRSRNYLEVQRKSHILLKDPNGLHYTAHLDNEALQELQRPSDAGEGKLE